MLTATVRFFDRIRTRLIRALVLYLARPANVLSTLAGSDLRALSEVLDRGDILLSAGNTRCASLVKRITRSTWSHVSMYVGPLEEAADPLCIVEADIAGGVRSIRLSQLNARRVCVLRPIQLDVTERHRLADSVVSRIGSEYDLRHALALARNLLVRRWRARLGSLPATMGKGATRFICSSLIAQAFAVVGHTILPPESPSGRAGAAHHACLTPADFERVPLFEVVWRASTSDDAA